MPDVPNVVFRSSLFDFDERKQPKEPMKVPDALKRKLPETLDEVSDPKLQWDKILLFHLELCFPLNSVFKFSDFKTRLDDFAAKKHFLVFLDSHRYCKSRCQPGKPK